jgi:hypothetical protein
VEILVTLLYFVSCILMVWGFIAPPIPGKDYVGSGRVANVTLWAGIILLIVAVVMGSFLKS